MQHLKREITALLKNEHLDDALPHISKLLHNKIPHFDWVGFYVMNDARHILELAAFAGEPTEHKEIPYGKGICGQVAVSGQTFVVDDVKTEDNYIACSLDTKSELVVPVYNGKKLVAQLDVDSHQKATFNTEITAFCEWICQEVGRSWQND